MKLKKLKFRTVILKFKLQGPGEAINRDSDHTVKWNGKTLTITAIRPSRIWESDQPRVLASGSGLISIAMSQVKPERLKKSQVTVPEDGWWMVRPR